MPGGVGVVVSQRAGQRLDLAHRAAGVGVAPPQLGAVLGVLLRDGEQRQHGADVDVVDGATASRVPMVSGEVVAGVEEDDVDPARHRGGQRSEHAVTHRAGDHEAVTERLDGPAQHVLRAGALELLRSGQRKRLQLLRVLAHAPIQPAGAPSASRDRLGSVDEGAPVLLDWSRDEIEANIDGILDVYAEAMGSSRSEARGRRSVVAGHLGRAGLRAVAAVQDDRLVGHRLRLPRRSRPVVARPRQGCRARGRPRARPHLAAARPSRCASCTSGRPLHGQGVGRDLLLRLLAGAEAVDGGADDARTGRPGPGGSTGRAAGSSWSAGCGSPATRARSPYSV